MLIEKELINVLSFLKENNLYIEVKCSVCNGSGYVKCSTPFCLGPIEHTHEYDSHVCDPHPCYNCTKSRKLKNILEMYHKVMTEQLYYVDLKYNFGKNSHLEVETQELKCESLNEVLSEKK